MTNDNEHEFDPTKMTNDQIFEHLRKFGDEETHRRFSRLDRLCDKFRIVQHSGSMAAYRLAEHYADDYFPWMGRTEPLVPEADMRELFAFTDRFCRNYDFADVTEAQMSEAAGVVYGCYDDEIAIGKELRFDKAWPVLFPEKPKPRGWYRWVAQTLGLSQKPYWPALDRDIRRLNESWGGEPSDEGLAERLHIVVDTVQHGWRQMGPVPPPKHPEPPIPDGQHRIRPIRKEPRDEGGDEPP